MMKKLTMIHLKNYIHNYDEEYRTQVELDLIERIKKIVSR